MMPGVVGTGLFINMCESLLWDAGQLRQHEGEALLLAREAWHVFTLSPQPTARYTCLSRSLCLNVCARVDGELNSAF